MDQYFFIQHPDDAYIPIKQTPGGDYRLLDENDGTIHKLYQDISINDVRPLLERESVASLIKKQLLIPISHFSTIQQNIPPRDLVLLEDLSEASLLHTLRHRYSRHKIYTWLSGLLIAVNPFKPVHIYTPEKMQYYYDYYNPHNAPSAEPDGSGEDQGINNGVVEPHIFAVASQMLYALSTYKATSCIVSGVSGSGKSKSTTSLLQYLTSPQVLGGSGADDDGDSDLQHAKNIAAKIAAFTPILESWGNAKTINNNNSSRFGKYIRLFFAPTTNRAGFSLFGAYLEQYLLEKSRVVYQSPNERNYHCFYQLLSGGLVAEELKLLELTGKTVADFRILSGGVHSTTEDLDTIGNNDAHDQMVTKNALLKFFSYDECLLIFKILSALLHMGNIVFEKDPKTMNDACQLHPDSLPVVDIVVKLLGIDKDLFEMGLLKTKIQAGKDIVTKVKNKDNAAASLQALIKCIYSSLFNYIIRNMNQQLLKPTSSNSNNLTHATNPLDHLPGNTRTISLLDIFGFEVFEVNSFEQLLINYTNENLFHFFTTYIITAELEQYRLDDIVIDMSLIKYNDNTECIAMIEPLNSTSSSALLTMCTDELKIPRGSDLTLLEKYNQKHEYNQYYVKAKSTATMNFGVKHYATTVNYTITDFLAKNRDEVQYDLLHAVFLTNLQPLKQLLSLSNPVLPQVNSDGSIATAPLGNAPQPTRPGGAGAKGIQSVTASFKTSLQSLIAVLNDSQPFFVSCIKSNNEKKAFRFHGELILQQINNLGLNAICVLRKQGYPHRYQYLKFFERYFVLVLHLISQLDTISSSTHGAELSGLLHDNNDEILTLLKTQITSFNDIQQMFQRQPPGSKLFYNILRVVLLFYTTPLVIQHLLNDLPRGSVTPALVQLKVNQKIDFNVGKVNVYYRTSIEMLLDVCRNHYYEKQLNNLISQIKTKVTRRLYQEKAETVENMKNVLLRYENEQMYTTLSSLDQLNTFYNQVLAPCHAETMAFFNAPTKTKHSLRATLFEHYQHYTLESITEHTVNALYLTPHDLATDSDKMVMYKFLLLKLFVEQQISSLEYLQRQLLSNEKRALYTAILLLKNTWLVQNICNTTTPTMHMGYVYILFHNIIINSIMGSGTNHLIYNKKNNNALIDLDNIESEADINYVIHSLQQNDLTIENLPFFNDKTHPNVTYNSDAESSTCLHLYEQQQEYKMAILSLKDLLAFDFLFKKTTKERTLELAAQLVNTAKTLNINSTSADRYQQCEKLYQQITLEIAEKERLRKEKEEQERKKREEEERKKREQEEKAALKKKQQEEEEKERLLFVEQAAMEKERLRIEKERDEMVKQRKIDEEAAIQKQNEEYAAQQQLLQDEANGFTTPKKKPPTPTNAPTAAPAEKPKLINAPTRKQQTIHLLHLIKKGNTAKEISQYLTQIQNSPHYNDYNSTSLFDLSLQQAISNIKLDDHQEDVKQYFAMQYNKKLAHDLNTPHDSVNNAVGKQMLKTLQQMNSGAVGPLSKDVNNANESGNNTSSESTTSTGGKGDKSDQSILYLPITHALLHCPTQTVQQSSLLTASPLLQQTSLDYNFDIVNVLLSFGASINAVTYNGLTTLSLLIKQAKFGIAIHVIKAYNASISQYDAEESSNNNIAHCLASALYKILYEKQTNAASPKDEKGSLKQLKKSKDGGKDTRYKNSTMKQFRELLELILQRNDRIIFFSYNNEGKSPYWYLTSTITAFLRDQKHLLTGAPSPTASRGDTSAADFVRLVEEIDIMLKKHIEDNGYVIKL